MAYRQNVEIVSSIAYDLPLVDMDSSQLVIALSNIFENALESIHDSGKIELTVKKVNDHSISIIVKDTGSGISAEEIDSVYDPFMTSKTMGVGLGLTMVHQIIANHHGELVGKVFDEEFIWHCRTCTACMEVCPGLIEHVDTLMEIRRNEALIQGRMPADARARPDARVQR
jgi:light-regulated signal transduction histidine kinase (bacteriophytochrome)